jgi:hypothetical protein
VGEERQMLQASPIVEWIQAGKPMLLYAVARRDIARTLLKQCRIGFQPVAWSTARRLRNWQLAYSETNNEKNNSWNGYACLQRGVRNGVDS